MISKTKKTARKTTTGRFVTTGKTSAKGMAVTRKSTNKVRAANLPDKKNSPILKAVHEAAAGLHAIGVMDQTTMRDFDALCLPKVPDYTPAQIKAIRARCNASQTVFAMYMNITPSSLQKWETGAKKPSSVALKLLSLVDKRGLEALL